MWYSDDMFHYTFKAEFVTLVSLTVPVGVAKIRKEIAINSPSFFSRPLQFWVAYAPCGSQHKDAVQITLEQIDLIKRLVNQYPNHLQVCHILASKNFAD